MAHGDKPLQIERSNREVIEQQLLTGLDDRSRVGILATEDELKMIIDGLDAQMQLTTGWDPKILHYRRDAYELGHQCFGWPALPPA